MTWIDAGARAVRDAGGSAVGAPRVIRWTAVVTLVLAIEGLVSILHYPGKATGCSGWPP
jgi:hypothetical protein